MREAFSDADTFRVEQETLGFDATFSLLVLTNAFVIDLDFFENKGGA